MRTENSVLLFVQLHKNKSITFFHHAAFSRAL